MNFYNNWKLIISTILKLNPRSDIAEALTSSHALNRWKQRNSGYAFISIGFGCKSDGHFWWDSLYVRQ